MFGEKVVKRWLSQYRLVYIGKARAANKAYLLVISLALYYSTFLAGKICVLGMGMDHHSVGACVGGLPLAADAALRMDWVLSPLGIQVLICVTAVSDTLIKDRPMQKRMGRRRSCCKALAALTDEK